MEHEEGNGERGNEQGERTKEKSTTPTVAGGVGRRLISEACA